MMRAVFHLPLRQTEGFLSSLLRLMGLDLSAPDHTTLSRRNKDVEVPRLVRDHDGSIHLIVDSSGLKISGNGEWHHQLGRAENTSFRYNRILGGRLRAIDPESQGREALIGCQVLNRIAELAMPVCYSDA